MGGTIGLIKEVLPNPNAKVVTLAETLDKKEGLQRFWSSSSGKEVLNSLQSDSRSIWTQLSAFESLSVDEIRSLLAKFRSNTITLSTLRGSSNVDEIQEMLDQAVKEQASFKR